MIIINSVKQLIPNSLKQKGKNLLMDLLKIPYSKSGVPLEILTWLPPGKPITFIDIGASVGHFSTSICGEYQVAKGILIEPLYQWIPTLSEKFRDKVTFNIINAAVSDNVGETDFYFAEEFDSISSLLKIKNESTELSSLGVKTPTTIKIKTQTLDYIVHQENLNSIDLLKIDVQGAEHLVLKGAGEALKITKLVYTEFSFKPLYEGSSTFFDLYKIFTENNFSLVNISPGYTAPNGELLQGDALFVHNKHKN